MKKSKQAVGWLALITAATLTMTGCAGTPTDAGDGDNGAVDGEIVGGPGVDVDAKTIRVGALVPVSGVFAGAVTNIEGLDAGFYRATQPDGVLEGWTVEVENQDTKYDAATAIPLYESFKDSVAIISLVLGSTIIDALLPSVEQDEMTLVPGGTTPQLLTEPNVIPTLPLTSGHAVSLVPYAIEKYDKGDAVFCSLTVEDAFGTAIQENLDYAVQELGLKKGVYATFAPNTDQFTPQITAMKDAGCEVVLVGGTGPFLQNLAVQSVQQDFNPMVLASNSAYTITLATGPGADWLIKNAIVSVPGDDWAGKNAPGQEMLIEDLAATYPDTTPGANAHLTGYVNATYTAKVLAKAIENGDLSRAGIVAAIGDIDVWEDELGMVGGDVVFGTSPEERIPPHKLSMFRIDPSVPTGLVIEEYYYDSELAQKYSESLQG